MCFNIELGGPSLKLSRSQLFRDIYQLLSILWKNNVPSRSYRRSKVTSSPHYIKNQRNWWAVMDGT